VKALLLRLSGQTLVYGLSAAAISVVGVFTLPILAHTLTPREYGVLELSVVAAGFLALLVDLGFASASQRSYYDYAPERQSERRLVLATALSTCTGFAIVICGIVLALSGPLASWLFGDRGYQDVIVVSAVAIPIALVAQFFREIMRLTLRPWPYAASAAVTAVLGGVVGVWLVAAYDQGPVGMQTGGLVGATAALFFGLVIVRHELVVGFSRRELRVMLRYGLPLVPSGIALFGLALIDRLLLSRLGDLEEVGRYAVASRLASVLTLVVAAFATAYSPFLLSLHNESPDEERELRGRVLTYLTLVLFLLALVIGLFSEELIRVVAPGYGNVAPAAVVLLLGVAANGVGMVALAGITIARATGSIARHTAVALVVNVAACLILIPPFGTTGAAIGTALGYTLLTALYFRTAQRLQPAPFEPRRVAAVVAVVVVCMPVAFVSFPSTAVAFAVKLATFAVAVGALWPLGVIGPMEREFLRGLVRGLQARPEDPSQ
jgi:O-antigen/teichoic acid export membrane protein